MGDSQWLMCVANCLPPDSGIGRLDYNFRKVLSFVERRDILRASAFEYEGFVQAAIV